MSLISHQHLGKSIVSVGCLTLIAAIHGSHIYRLRIAGYAHAGGEAKAILSQRFRAFDPTSYLGCSSDGQLILSTEASVSVVRRLIDRGRLTVKAFPGGVPYQPADRRIVSKAWAASDIAGRPAVYFTLVKPDAFRRFTASHQNQTIVFYIDGRAIQEGRIINPIARIGEIDQVGMSRSGATLLASLLSTPPLNVTVTVVESKSAMRVQGGSCAPEEST
jgi:hypothetical protein